MGECQQRDLRDFADGQDWGRGAAVAMLAVGRAAGGWRSGLGFEGLGGCAAELFGTLRQVRRSATTTGSGGPEPHPESDGNPKPNSANDWEYELQRFQQEVQNPLEDEDECNGEYAAYDHAG